MQEHTNMDHIVSDVAGLLARTGRCKGSGQQALCIELGLRPSYLSFLGTAGSEFAVELVAHIVSNGLQEPLKALEEILLERLHGELQVKTRSVVKELGAVLPEENLEAIKPTLSSLEDELADLITRAFSIAMPGVSRRSLLIELGMNREEGLFEDYLVEGSAGVIAGSGAGEARLLVK